MKAKRVTFLGIFIALAMILSFVEHQIPALVAIPGIKVGLPNIVMVFLLYRVGWKETVIVSIIRIILVSMLFGNMQTMTFSIAGAIFSLVGMFLLKRLNWFSCVTVSITGSILHNIGQIVAAVFWTGTAQIVFYLPILLVSGTVAGTLIGLLAGMMIKRLQNWKI